MNRSFATSVMVLILTCYTAVLAQNNGCPTDYTGFLTPRLQAGQRGVVIPGGSSNRVRANPATDAEQIGTIAPGTEFAIIDGPVCAASIIWWQVDTGDLQGWTAEGLLPDEYFLEPAAPPTLTPTARSSSTPSPTPTAVSYPAVDLPELAVLSPENAAAMEIVGQIPQLGAGSLFMTPGYILPVFYSRSGTASVNVHTFPDFQPVTQGLSADMANGQLLFSDNSVVSIASDDITFYQFGEPSPVIDKEVFRRIHTAALSPAGILAVSFGYLNQSSIDQLTLCLIDQFGDTYGTEHRLCIPQESAITTMTFLNDGVRLLARTVDKLMVYDVMNGDVLQTFNYRIAPNTNISRLPDTDTVLLPQQDFVLSVNLETGEERTYPNGVGKIVEDIIIRADGSQMMLIVRTTNVPDVLVVDVESKAILHRDSLYGGEKASYSPDGSLAFINNAVFETQTWQLLHKLGGAQHIISFSPDGKMLFVLNTRADVFEIFGVPAS